MNIRDMRKQIPCTSCKSFKAHRFDLCAEQRRCPILVGTQLVLAWTTDEDYDKFSSGIRRI